MGKTAPATTVATDRTQRPPKWKIVLGGPAGLVPTDHNETKAIHSPVVHLVHGKQLPRCDFIYQLGSNRSVYTSDRLVNKQLEAEFARQVEVWQAATDSKMQDTLIFWGDLNEQTMSAGRRGESVTVTASVEPYHFGIPCPGTQYRQPVSPYGTIQTQDSIVFNPEINGVVEPNRSKYRSTDETKLYYYWVDPDSVRTAASRQYGQDLEVPATWTLAQAIHTISWVCNPDSTFIKNPSKKSIDGWLTDAPAIKNLELPVGKYLPDYLDAMLYPNGYGWAMTFGKDENKNRTVSWRIFKLGDSETTVLYQQRPGDTDGLQAGNTNVTDFSFSTGIIGQPNQITVLGDYEEYEITVELYRGWLESEDGYSASQLTQSTGEYWATHQRAWRWWVANEGGDYCGTRTSVALIPLTAKDLTEVLGADYHIKNRKPYDCLTHWKDDASGEKRNRRPPFIEWYTDGAWKPLPDGWGETVADNELAVKFAADSPPAQLIAAGTGARIRMTCTIRGDERLKYTSERATDSISIRTNEQVIEVPDRYKYRVIHNTGTLASTLDGDPSSDARDDTAALITFADKMRLIEDAATVRGTLTTHGLQIQLKVGQTVSDIKGRDISLNRKARTAIDKKYVQIVGLTHDFNAQTTTVKLAPITEGVT